MVAGHDEDLRGRYAGRRGDAPEPFAAASSYSVGVPPGAGVGDVAGHQDASIGGSGLLPSAAGRCPLTISAEDQALVPAIGPVAMAGVDVREVDPAEEGIHRSERLPRPPGRQATCLEQDQGTASRFSRGEHHRICFLSTVPEHRIRPVKSWTPPSVSSSGSSSAPTAAPRSKRPRPGQIPCRYCHAVNQLSVRDDRPAFPPTAPISEQERINRLRAQDGRPLLPPPSLQALLPNGQLPAWKVQEALAVWQATGRSSA